MARDWGQMSGQTGTVGVFWLVDLAGARTERDQTAGRRHGVERMSGNAKRRPLKRLEGLLQLILRHRRCTGGAAGVVQTRRGQR
jgi:hypothetical protein